MPAATGNHGEPQSSATNRGNPAGQQVTRGRGHVFLGEDKQGRYGYNHRVLSQHVAGHAAGGRGLVFLVRSFVYGRNFGGAALPGGPLAGLPPLGQKLHSNEDEVDGNAENNGAERHRAISRIAKKHR